MDQLSCPNTTASVYSVLKSLPRGLYGTYNRILDGIPSQNEALAVKTLRWLAHAVVPISLFELVEAIAIDEGSSSLSDVHTLLVSEDIFQICGSLIRRSEVTGILSLAHNSVYEFLTDFDSQPNHPTPYHIPAAQSMVPLVKACLTYLSFQEFNSAHMQARMGSDADGEFHSSLAKFEDLPECHFYDYALKNWWRYLPHSTEGLDDVWPCLDRFFDKRSGNFEACVKILHHTESTYRYPTAMQPIHFCATHGLHLVFQRLLRSPTTDTECKAQDGRRALHFAAENGQEIVVQHLLSAGANVNAESADGRTPLQLAIESGNGSIVQLLVRGGALVNTKFIGGETPLSVAVSNNWASLVQILLKEQANPNGRLPDGRTSLHVAADLSSDIDIITLLLHEGADPDIGDEKSWTALHYAARSGYFEAASLLMLTKRTGDLFNKIGWTPLHAAIEQEHVEVAELFTQFAAKISELLTSQTETQQSWATSTPQRGFDKTQGTAQNAEESSSEEDTSSRPKISMRRYVPTPLFLATSQGFLAGVNVLMEAGVSSKDVQACRQYAFTKGNVAVLEILMVDSEQNIDSLLSLRQNDAPMSGRSQLTLEMLFRSFRWDKSNITDAMKRVIRESNLKLLKLLMERYFLLDDKSQPQTAHMLPSVVVIAVECGDIHALELLQMTGIELSGLMPTGIRRHNLRNVSCTLLHLAAHLQNPDMLSYLVRWISPNAKDAIGRTPLFYVSKHENTQKTISILLSSGADMLIRDHQGWTPLHMASHYNISQSVSSLLEAGAQADVLDDAEMTPLHHCAFFCSSLSMLHLLDAGASTSLLDKDGYTPLQLALLHSIQANSLDDVSQILDQRDDLIHARFPPLDRTPLHLAAEVNCESSILNLLINRKADLEAEDRDGKTAVQVAGSSAHRSLINRGAQWRV